MVLPQSFIKTMHPDEIRKILIDEKLKNHTGLFEFDGHNCGDLDVGCDGWDGQSHRCECGNRRVEWVLSDDQTYIFAEAY